MHMRLPPLFIVAIPALLALACCSQAPPPADAATLAPEPGHEDPSPGTADAKPGTACWLLPAEKMSEIVGEPLVAKADDGAIEYGFSSCAYFTPSGHHHRLTFSYEAAGGATKRMVMDIPPHGPATAQNPYADLGDGATMAHGVLFIVDGDAAVSIDASKLPGPDQHALAERVLAALAARGEG